MKLAVLGAGAWGTALAINFCAQHEVRLWTRDPDCAAAIRKSRINARYLPGYPIPEQVLVGTDPLECVRGCEVAICAVPVSALRDVLGRIHGTDATLVLACKGFERRSGALPHDVVGAVLSERATCTLSGPSFAQEVARGLPTAVVLAARDEPLAQRLARDLHGPRLRIYSSDDLIGVEVAGAAKNVIAIAAGICDGLELGLNARAALISRGLAEVARLGLHAGGRIATFMGLAGAGDLVLTCTGGLSRNRTVGLRLATGARLDVILDSLGHVAEGVGTAYEIAALARRAGIDMPITAAVCQVLDGTLSPSAAVSRLMERDPKAEFQLPERAQPHR
jgi:glycerol-3-phosphate dehydrogenase (NAD(P)+)